MATALHGHDQLHICQLPLLYFHLLFGNSHFFVFQFIFELVEERWLGAFGFELFLGLHQGRSCGIY